jgi:hypothetical protein
LGGKDGRCPRILSTRLPPSYKTVEKGLIQLFFSLVPAGSADGSFAVHGKSDKDFLASIVFAAYFLVLFMDD